jgi:SAM-dependent methyltransferase
MYEWLWQIRRGILGHIPYRNVPPHYWAMNALHHSFCPPNTLDSLKRKRFLEEKYRLSTFLLPTWKWAELESFFVLDQLDALIAKATLVPANSYWDIADRNKPRIWVDVGSKNLAYFPALCAAANSDKRPFHLYGVELDAYRFYEDGYTRGDYARGMAFALQPYVTYCEGEYVALKQQGVIPNAHVVSCFLPFVSIQAHQAWGLSSSTYQPERLLKAMWDTLVPGGVLLISNLMPSEVKVQRMLFNTLGLLSEMQEDLGLMNQTQTKDSSILETYPIKHETQFLRVQQKVRYLWSIRKPFDY